MLALKHIVFVIPEFMVGVGGAETLVINMTRALIAEDALHVNVKVVCTKDSFVHQQLRESDPERVRFLFWGQPIPAIERDSLIVTWGGFSTLWKLRANYARLLVWSIFPGAPTTHFFQFPAPFNWMRSYLKKVCRRTMEYLVLNNGLVSMDRPNHIEIERKCGRPFLPKYLPVPVTIGKNNYANRFSIPAAKRTFRLTWVGRGGVEWKVFPLAKFIESIIVRRTGVELTIFTDDAKPYSRAFNQCAINGRIKITYETWVFGATLRNRLASDSDLHLGMGTSVLEGAAEGVPAICIDPQNELSRMAAWQWLYERKGFDLGNFEDVPDLRRPFDLEGLIDDWERLRVLSELSYQYVQKNHNVCVIAASLANWDTTTHVDSYLKAHGTIIFGANLAYCTLKKPLWA